MPAANRIDDGKRNQMLNLARRQRLIDEMSLDTIFERQASPLVRSSMHV